MKDPYEVLGVQKGDSDTAIRSAYRKLAKRHHPDVNPGKPEAADRFKEISAAYDIIGDKDKRARFDRGEIDAAGNEVPPQRPFYRDFSDAAGREKYGADTVFNQEDLESIFARAFGGGQGGGRGRQFSMRGQDAHYHLTLDFLDAVNGTTRRVTLPDGRTLDVRIPAGVVDSQVIRLKGQGMPGIGDGAPGDALVEVSIVPHPVFHREGDDIIVELPVTLQEAVLGATVEVPTIQGPVRLTIPANSGTGTRLRLRGRGVAGRGHQFVELRTVVPPVEEPELAEFLKTWKPRHPTDPRADMETG
jgi:DnaJ-class molecular chaperone